jgi:hypothetical protein
MSTHKEYITAWADDEHFCLAYEQDENGLNYVDIPLEDMAKELENFKERKEKELTRLTKE